MLRRIGSRVYYLGFVLSAVLAWAAYKYSSEAVQNLQTNFEREERVRALLYVNQIVQRSFALASLSVAQKNPNLFQESTKVFDSSITFLEKGTQIDKSVVDTYKPRLKEISKNLSELNAQFQATKNLSPNALIHVAGQIEKLGFDLTKEEAGSWRELVIDKVGFLKIQEKSNTTVRGIHAILVLFLSILMWTAVRKEKMEKQIRESEYFYRMLFASIAEGILLVDAKGRIVGCNQSSEKVLGRNVSQILKGNLKLFFNQVVKEDGTTLDFETKILGKALRGKPVLNETVGFILPNYDLRWISVSAQLIAGTEDKPEPQVILSCSDVSERIVAEKTVEKQKVQMVQAAKMSALGEMAGGIAHEIRNPLGIIMAQVEDIEDVVEEGKVEPGYLKKATGNVLQTVKRIGKIIDGLRTFSRDGRKDSFEMAKIGQLVDETLDLCQARFRSHEIELRKSVPKDLEFECRPVQISQVLLNLFNNAFDAVLEQKERWVDIEVSDHHDQIEIRIMDSGPGVPEHIREKIMQPFFTTKPVGKGTGLGLSISRGIIEMHQGVFKLDEESPSTCFVLFFPKRQEKRKAA